MENYRWRTKSKGIVSSRENVDPNVVAGVMKKIAEEKGKCTPVDLVNHARPEDSPIHRCFEWDDKKGAEEHRKAQARTLIRSIQVVRVGEEGKQERKTMMVHVPTTEKHKQQEAGYITIEKALNDKAARSAIVQGLIKQLQGMKSRYGEFHELDDIWSAIDKIAKQNGIPVARIVDRAQVISLHQVAM